MRETGTEIGLGVHTVCELSQPKWHDTRKVCELGAEPVK